MINPISRLRRNTQMKSGRTGNRLARIALTVGLMLTCPRGSGDGIRTWTDQRSRSIEATYIRATETEVTLIRQPGEQIFTIPLSTLSEEDRAFVARRRQEPPHAPGPRFDEGKQKMGDRIFYAAHLTPSRNKDAPITRLLIWCHPGSGDAQPEFDWLKKSLKPKNAACMVLAPQANERQWSIKNDSAFVESLIDEACKRYALTRDQVILGGHSSGAIFTYNFGPKQAKRVATLVTACGLMQTPPVPETSSLNQSILIYHSRNDNVFKFSDAQEALNTYQQLGFKTEFIEDSIGHSIGPKLAKAITSRLD